MLRMHPESLFFTSLKDGVSLLLDDEFLPLRFQQNSGWGWTSRVIYFETDG